MHARVSDLSEIRRIRTLYRILDSTTFEFLDLRIRRAGMAHMHAEHTCAAGNRTAVHGTPET
eukprot:COSAG05_NODE_7548_length_798_cov_1.088698_1_plen_62_part_00